VELKDAAAAVRDTVKRTGIEAITAMPYGGKRRYAEPVVAVNVKSGSGLDAAYYDYLGVETDEDTGLMREVYGKRMDIDFAIAIYSPDDAVYGAQGCMEVFGDVAEAMSDLPPGMRLKGISCGELKYDEAAGMFRLDGEIKCRAFTYAVSYDDGELTDFNLNGVVKL
jgi:hypothetical protein